MNQRQRAAHSHHQPTALENAVLSIQDGDCLSLLPADGSVILVNIGCVLSKSDPRHGFQRGSLVDLSQSMFVEQDVGAVANQMHQEERPPSVCTHSIADGKQCLEAKAVWELLGPAIHFS